MSPTSPWHLPLIAGSGHAQLCPFRFPGQYEDEETGLYCNRFRYDDPEAGGYVSQDPIGLAGGFELYSYVLDPVTFVDPFGLKKLSCGPRRTKHVDKLNQRTIDSPDRVIRQRNGRVRYEKDFDRTIGTRGETIKVVVVDHSKDKIVTSFPSLPEQHYGHRFLSKKHSYIFNS